MLNKHTRTKWNNRVSLSAAALLLVAPAVYYFAIFGWGWTTHSKWAEMGAYFSGMYAPILGLFTAIFLYRQISILHLQNEIMLRQSKIAENQNLISHSQVILNASDIRALIKATNNFTRSLRNFHEFSRAYLVRALDPTQEVKATAEQWYERAIGEAHINSDEYTTLITEMQILEELFPRSKESFMRFRKIITKIQNFQTFDYAVLIDLKSKIKSDLITIKYKSGEQENINALHFCFDHDTAENSKRLEKITLKSEALLVDEGSAEYLFLSKLVLPIKELKITKSQSRDFYGLLNIYEEKNIEQVEKELINIITSEINLSALS